MDRLYDGAPPPEVKEPKKAGRALGGVRGRRGKKKPITPDTIDDAINDGEFDDDDDDDNHHDAAHAAPPTAPEGKAEDSDEEEKVTKKEPKKRKRKEEGKLEESKKKKKRKKEEEGSEEEDNGKPKRKKKIDTGELILFLLTDMLDSNGGHCFFGRRPRRGRCPIE